MADLQGKVVYALIMEDQGTMGVMNSFRNGMKQVDNSVIASGRNMGSLNSNFANFGTQVKAGIPPLNQMKQAVGALPSAYSKSVQSIDQFGEATDKAGKKLGKFGQFMQKNRGLVFGGAGLAGAIGEAAGMLDMYAMASEGAAEAQAKVNELQKMGITEGKEMNAALKDQTQAEKFLTMARRNTILSLMDNITFSVMMLSSVSKMNISMTKLKSVVSGLGQAMGLGKLQALALGTNIGISGNAAATSMPKMAIFSGTVASVGPSSAVAVTGLRGMALAVKGLFLAMGPIGWIILAISTLVIAFTSNFLGFRDAIYSVGKTIGDALPFLKGFLDWLKGAADATVNFFNGQDTSAQDATTGVQDYAAEWGEFQKNYELGLGKMTEMQTEFDKAMKLTGGDTEASIKWVEQYIDGMAGVSAEQKEVLKSMFGASVKEDAKAMKEGGEAAKRYAEDLKESQDALFGWTNTATNNISINENMKDALDDLIGSSIEHATMLRDEDRALKDVTDTAMMSFDQSQKTRREHAMEVDILSATTKGYIMRSEATTKAMEATEDFVTKLESERIALTAGRPLLEKMTKDMHPFLDVTAQTTEGLKQLVEEGMNGVIKGSPEYAAALEEATDASMGFFDSILGADNNKDFNKKWKEFDLGSIPKNLKDDWKKFFKDMRPAAEHGMEVATALNMVSLAINGIGEGISDSDIHKTMEEIVKDFDKFAAIDPEAMQLQKVPGLFDDITNHAKDFPLTIAALTEAMADNNITTEEANKIIGAYGKESGKAVKPVEDLNAATANIDPRDKVARQINQITINQNMFARAVRGTTGDLNNNQKEINGLGKLLDLLARRTNQNFKNFNMLGRAIRGVSADAIQLKKNLDAIPRNIKIKITASGSGLQYADHGMHTTLAHDQLIYAHKGERVDIGHGSTARTNSSSPSFGGSDSGNQHTTIILKIGGKTIKQELDYQIGQVIEEYIP